MPHGGRHFFWVDTLLTQQVASGGAQINSLLTGLTATESRMGLTLMRLILCLDIAALVHDAGEGSQFVDTGIGIVSQEAFTAAVFPDPATAADFPVGGWLFRCRVRTYGFATDQAAVYNRVLERDLGAKRKINNGELYIHTQNTADQASTHTISLSGVVRALFLST